VIATGPSRNGADFAEEGNGDNAYYTVSLAQSVVPATTTAYSP